MGIRLGIANIIMGLVNTIGAILAFIGFFNLVGTGQYWLLTFGLLLVLAAESAGIYMIKHEERRKLEYMKNDFTRNVGAAFAWPVLLLLLYLLAPTRTMLALTFIVTLTATINVTSLIIKVYLIDKRIAYV